MPGYCKEQDGEKKMKVEEYRHHRSKDRSKALQCIMASKSQKRKNMPPRDKKPCSKDVKVKNLNIAKLRSSSVKQIKEKKKKYKKKNKEEENTIQKNRNQIIKRYVGKN